MDIKLNVDNMKFKYRVSAIIENDDEILVIGDENGDYEYLHGGHVMLNETCEEAMKRELKEELSIDIKNMRAVWFNQAFFENDVSKIRFHEICMYYLIDIKDTNLIKKEKPYTIKEGKHTFRLRWVKKKELKNQYFYPVFLKEKIMNIPENLEMNIEKE